MIYPPNADINEQVARTMILELYTLPKIQSWHVYEFAKKFGVIVTTKMDIRKIAIDRGMNIKDIISNYKQRVKQIAIAVCLLFTFNLSAQVQPKADTAKFVQGVNNSFNVLANDIGFNLKVTSWTLNGVKKDTGKIIPIVGIGTVLISGKGLLTYVCKNDTFSGYLPEISYIANNTQLRGVSAKVTIIIFKRPKPTTSVSPAYIIYKEDSQIIIDYGGIRYVGQLYAWPVCGTTILYCVVSGDTIYRLSKQEYDILTN
jgi:hypothetical protein